MSSSLDLDRINHQFGAQPQALVEWALGLGKRSMITSNFGPFAAVVLHMVTRVEPEIPVIWMDSGYNTTATYRFADELTRTLKLNLRTFLPLRTRAQREALEGGIPVPTDPAHTAFTREVKLEPFERAVRTIQAEVWFTAIRKDQTAFRASLNPVTIANEGMLRIAPVFHWSSRQMNDYLKLHGLPNSFDYYDPTKFEEARECGLHTAN